MKSEAERREDLQTRITQFHGVSFEQILDEIQYLRDSGDSVLAGGSLAYGLGNQLSDLDLLVAGPSTVECSRVPIEHFLGSLRVDVWKLTEKVIEETFDRAEEALASEDPLIGSFGDVHHEGDLKLIHRIAFGVVLDGPGLEAVEGRDHCAVATMLVLREYAERMRASALLAQYALAAGRTTAAVVNARLAVEEALNAAVSYRGLPFSGDKWLRERLATEAGDLAGVYEPFRQLPEEPARDAQQFVDDAIAACTEMWGLDLSVEALTRAVSWRNIDLRQIDIGTDRLLLSPRYGSLWRLSKGEAETWDRIVALGAEGDDPTWGSWECDPEARLLCLRLYEHGLLQLQWVDAVALESLEAKRSVQV